MKLFKIKVYHENMDYPPVAPAPRRRANQAVNILAGDVPGQAQFVNRVEGDWIADAPAVAPARPQRHVPEWKPEENYTETWIVLDAVNKMYTNISYGRESFGVLVGSEYLELQEDEYNGLITALKEYNPMLGE